MILSTADKGNRFSDLIQLHDLYYSSILECRATPCNIFAKPVSETEIAVFGDYKILVLYRNLFTSGKKDYGAITINRNICEVIPLEVKEHTEVKPVLLLQPSCKFKYDQRQNINPYWEIEVQGEIKLEAEAHTPFSNFVASMELPENAPESKDSSPFQSQVWEFEGNEDVPIEELMEMNLETLKNMKKNSNH